MGRAVEVWGGDAEAHNAGVCRTVHGTRRHHTLWMGVVYAMTVVTVLAVVAKLY